MTHDDSAGEAVEATLRFRDSVLSRVEAESRGFSAGIYGLLALSMTVSIGMGSIWGREPFIGAAASAFILFFGFFYLSYLYAAEPLSAANDKKKESVSREGILSYEQLLEVYALHIVDAQAIADEKGKWMGVLIALVLLQMLASSFLLLI